ncbi:MAG TPA: twin-arginine translocation signal domain-containing protein [Bryobacteraceae bacterium]|nr:twin-arginine translocation signal domain-containing protein [Bryobacteraceae bacterium]
MTITRRQFIQAAGVGAGLGVLSKAGFAFHDHPNIGGPTYGEIRNMRVLGYTNLSGNDGGGYDIPGGDSRALDPNSNLPWDRVAEFRVRRGYAIASQYQGWSIVDVRDPSNMRVVWRYQNEPAPNNTQYIEASRDGNLVVQKQNDALKMWDISNKSNPVLLSSFTPDDLEESYHGLWLHEDDRGRFAMAAVHLEGYTDQILQIVDITDPTAPREISRYHYPGMWTAGGETPTWPMIDERNNRVQAHDLTTFADRAYVAWRDKGIVILDISNMARPVKVGEVNWSDLSRPDFPALPGETHSVGIVLDHVQRNGRAGTIVVPDELGACPYGYMHFLDVRDESRPREISGYRNPLSMHANCPLEGEEPSRAGRRFGTHDVERMIRDKVVWSAWEEGGFWGVDFRRIHYPRWVGYFLPPVRSDSPPESQSGHADDVFVTREGIIFGSSSDPGAGGLWAMRYDRGRRGTMVWNADETDVTFQSDRNNDNDDDDN